MKCISLWQPWASLIGRGKSIETRSWGTAYRGPIAIHAAKRWTPEEIAVCEQEPFRTVLLKEGFGQFTPTGVFTRFYLPLGAIVAVAHLDRCLPVAKIHPTFMTPDEEAFGNYGPGRFGWIFEDIRLLKTPIPYRGQQGLFEVPDSLLEGAL